MTSAGQVWVGIYSYAYSGIAHPLDMIENGILQVPVLAAVLSSAWRIARSS
jgi:hypothetical protein